MASRTPSGSGSIPNSPLMRDSDRLLGGPFDPIRHRRGQGFNGSPVISTASLSYSPNNSRPATAYSDDPYSGARTGSVRGISQPLPSSISEKYSFSPNPTHWGADLSTDLVEDDDYLHEPDPKGLDQGDCCSVRGFVNVGCLVVLLAGIITLFAGYPIISHFASKTSTTTTTTGSSFINATGESPRLSGASGSVLIDPDTPAEKYTIAGWNDGSEYELVYSDEFNTDGRTFYPGDDPYWEAADLHYWATNNLEWYDPAAVITQNGSLRITLSSKETHGLNYQGGMMTTWNKFCFTGGYVEASVSLPGANNVRGLWPAVWMMGNLGRAGYGASLDGTWPYTYDSCDVGTVQNQTVNGQPEAATVDGDTSAGGVLSYLPGQRLSRCTCTGESHPGPMHSDGTYVGRAAPEIDIFEAQVAGDPLVGEVSQSGQWAPFNYAYEWFNTSSNLVIKDSTISELNTYLGGVYQQATSVVTETDQDCYTGETGCFSTYGLEYKPGYEDDDAYLTWVSNNKASWTLNAAGMAADSRVEIGDRPVPQEPMYLIMNLGMSENFGTIDFDELTFPTYMEIDYIRVYQPKGEKNIGCNPSSFPTEDYINTFSDAYANPNLTTWVNDYNQTIPKNSFLGQC